MPPDGLRYLAATWLPWLLVICATASMGVQAFFHRANCDAEVAAAVSSATPKTPFVEELPWLPIGVGIVDLTETEGVRLIHMTALFPLNYPSCLLRTTVVIDSPKGPGTTDVSIEQVDDCQFLLQSYRPRCDGEDCEPTNGQKQL